MNVKHGENFSILISSTIGAYSIEHLNDVLDTILLIISIANILTVLVFKLCRYLKDGKLDKEEIKDLKQDASMLVDEVQKLEEKEGDTK